MLSQSKPSKIIICGFLLCVGLGCLFYKYDKIELQLNMIRFNYNHHSATATEISLKKTNLTYFLQQFNKSILLHYIREIELSIKLTNDSNCSEWNELYSTGYSPHFYDLPFSFSKSCKHIKFSYLCGFNPLNLSNFTFKINETMLSFEGQQFLHKIQEYGFYTNLHETFVSNLKLFKSPYMVKTNALFMGNSHIRQLVDSLFCVIDDTPNINIVKHYVPHISLINNTNTNTSTMRKEFERSYSKLRCDKQVLHSVRSNAWNLHRDGTSNKPLMLNQTMSDRFQDYMSTNNIQTCDDSKLYVNFGDNSNLLYTFMHTQENKTLSYFYSKYIFENNSNINTNKSIINSIINNLDILTFNFGNHPVYDFDNLFDDDLDLLMNNTINNNKDITFILLSGWYAPIRVANVNKYKNMIGIDWKKRFQLKHNFNVTLPTPTLGHPCQPGLPEHAMLSITNLINFLLQINRSKKI